jgi:hypothetical protein
MQGSYSPIHQSCFGSSLSCAMFHAHGFICESTRPTSYLRTQTFLVMFSQLSSASLALDWSSSSLWSRLGSTRMLFRAVKYDVSYDFS